MSAYYNEHDPVAAQWLRNLIAAGHIAPGEVDERSIIDVQGSDLIGFTQCHFFAGVGVWPHALRRAGWSDDRPVWTGSCPCQPFSAAGQQKGFDDARHLWPHWFRLIAERRPAIVLGEQVASALAWLDLVSADMEGAGYAIGAADLCAAGFDGAHIRQRLYFAAVANADDARSQGRGGMSERADECTVGPGSVAGGLGDTIGDGWRAGRDRDHARDDGAQLGPTRADGGLADASSGDASAEREQRGGQYGFQPQNGSAGGQGGKGPRDRQFGGLADTANTGCAAGGIRGGQGAAREIFHMQPANCGEAVAERDGWPDAPMLGRTPVDWLFCRDGKWRPVEPGTFPLADAAPARVGRLRAYGNGLDAETATEFCTAVAETIGIRPVAWEYDL